MADLIITGAALTIANKLLGKTAEAIAGDLARLYNGGRDRIIASALRKVADIHDNKKANLRVARDVFFNGSFTDEAICAEYFGGILASSRSKDGKDDSGVFYTDIIKSLSSQQLLLHYVIYRSFNKILLAMPSEKKRPSVSMMPELQPYKIYFLTKEILELGINGEVDLLAVINKDLVSDECEAAPYKTKEGREIHFTKVQPSILGIQLYSVVNNKLAEWRKFPFEDFGDFPDIKTPPHFSLLLDDLSNI